MACDEPPRARQADFNDCASPIPSDDTTKRGITIIGQLQEILPPRLLGDSVHRGKEIRYAAPLRIVG